MLARKYNPGFLTDDELVASFCVRTNEFDSIIEVLRECTGRSNPHQLVIGPRGSGKTTLLLRVAVEIRRDPELSTAFYPIVFAEESYEVATTGEFWLECLSRLAVQAPKRQGEPDLNLSYEELRTVRDDRTLAERCLGALLDFADRESKRLVLVVENLNMMFKDMLDRDAGWRLRKILQTEPRIVLLASATSRFDEIDNQDQALYELFRVSTLRPLNTNECAILWEVVCGQDRPPETIRSLEILTGGSPRLLAIVARFGAELSYRELMADLLDLVDDHTEYFKSHLETLPAQERRVYLALADLWKPANTREIADRARLDTSKCSAQLKRLTERGATQAVGGTARRKQYYLSERLYNIYYLLRRSRGPDNLVEALVHFMEAFYSPAELRDIGANIVLEVEGSDAATKVFQQTTLARLVARPVMAEYREELLAMIPEGLAGTLDQSTMHPTVSGKASVGAYSNQSHVSQLGEQTDSSKGLVKANALFDKAVKLEELNRKAETLEVYDEIARRFEKSDAPEILQLVARSLANKAVTLSELDRNEEALDACDEFILRFGESDAPLVLNLVATSLFFKGTLLSESGRRNQALVVYEEVLHRFGASKLEDLHYPVAASLQNKGVILISLNRTEEALAVFDDVVNRYGESETPTLQLQVAFALINKGGILHSLNMLDTALTTCNEVVRRFGESEIPTLLTQVATALVNKGKTFIVLNQPDEALAVYDEVAHRFGASNIPAVLKLVAIALSSKGSILAEINRPEEALATFDDLMRRFGASDTLTVMEPFVKALACRGAVLGGLNRHEEALATYDEIVERVGNSNSLTLQMVVALALVGKGVALGQLNRPLEALTALDEVASRFTECDSPSIREQVAKALIGKGAILGKLNRPVEALAAYDDVVQHFGTGNTLALRDLIAKALVGKGIALSHLDRQPEALNSYSEAIQRFSESEVPDILEQVAIALVNKGITLEMLDRSHEALASYEEVVRRFETSSAPTLLEPVARASISTGLILNRQNRTDDALATYDEVVERFGHSDWPALLEQVAMALFIKGLTLGGLNRVESALAAYDEVVRRFGASKRPTLRVLAARSLLGKADIELNHRRYEAAIETASRVLEMHHSESPDTQWYGHLIRAKAILACASPAESEQDINALLAILSEVGSLSKEHLYTLMTFSIEIGLERMCGLIRASSAATLLLPLTTALERELGLDPRVAQEVMEVAEDIRRDLAKFTEMKVDAESPEYATGSEKCLTSA